ncbi:alpha beta-hydrolase [Fusarium pseudocircinatum]|uniref:Alpha beta-hydrolase n=1 Tax=Fusarium pseudocircinatum TaxID=56676 RepID=A0A8H5LD53_9HYPO|nr:alpha beta-hydrolase [Fusarium pseudocircinatum]
MGATQYYRSQIGEESVIDYSHTDFPFKLLAKDVYYFFVYVWALPWVIWPVYPFKCKVFDELYPSPQNVFCVVVHLVLFFLQLGFIIALPFSVVFPVWMAAAGIAGFMFTNWLICKLLNGSKETYTSDEKYAKARPEHAHEQWVFLNGVAVGEHWMQSNLNRLALTFGRPILGIHNQTRGIIFDVVECLIQRNFGYATGDVRICFRLLKDILYDESKSKVVFVLHSQGGIEGGLVLDWLLQELPQDLMSKLEVYTFGNAANHFNNPHRHRSSQVLARLKPLSAMSTVLTESSFDSPSGSPLEAKDDLALKTRNPIRKESSGVSARSISAAKDRCILHVEHYANSTDFVAIWGILHFATNRMESRELPRFQGRLFSRADGRHGGHQMNQHYLNAMFPLKKDAETGEYVGADEDNEFMNEAIKVGEEGSASANAREAFEISWAGTQGFGSGDASTPIEVHGISNKIKEASDDHGVRVKDVSRLWSYRNGRSPVELPPMLVSENGVPRTATL